MEMCSLVTSLSCENSRILLVHFCLCSFNSEDVFFPDVVSHLVIETLNPHGNDYQTQMIFLFLCPFYVLLVYGRLLSRHLVYPCYSLGFLSILVLLVLFWDAINYGSDSLSLFPIFILYTLLEFFTSASAPITIGIIVTFIIIIIVVVYSLEFFTSALADSLSLEIERQQVYSSLQDPSQYFGCLQ